VTREDENGMPPEHQEEVGGETSEAEEVLSYGFPEDLVNAGFRNAPASRGAMDGWRP